MRVYVLETRAPFGELIIDWLLQDLEGDESPLEAKVVAALFPDDIAVIGFSAENWEHRDLLEQACVRARGKLYDDAEAYGGGFCYYRLVSGEPVPRVYGDSDTLGELPVPSQLLPLVLDEMKRRMNRTAEVQVEGWRDTEV